MSESGEPIIIYDATLREGAQGSGVSFSPEDKIRITLKLDGLGIPYVEGGYPGSNPTDIQFFQDVPGLKLQASTVVAFGSTRKPHTPPSSDPALRSLLDSGMSTVTLYGKSWPLHTREVLKTSLEENLRIIEDSVRFLRDHGLTVFYDAEHFFDGYREAPEYALRTLQAAANGGAQTIILCDTNGGVMVGDAQAAIRAAQAAIPVPLGIHAHNDSGLAVAISMAAVELGIGHVQGTFNGLGERCGNANLCTVIPNLELKARRRCIPEGRLSHITSVSVFISEIANQPHDKRQAYVGEFAFCHKAGAHVDGVLKNPKTFEHVPPEAIGNQRHTRLSAVSGRATLLDRVRQYEPNVDKSAPEVKHLLDLVKRLEHQGYRFEAAEASFELHVIRTFKKYREFFHRSGFRIVVEKMENGVHRSEATIKVQIGDRLVHTAADGDGPVNALDNALRKAIAEIYPQVHRIQLVDYKVHILEDSVGTGAKIRVLIESTDGEHRWGTVGVSENIIEASWEALVDSIEYGLLYRQHRNGGTAQPS